MLIFEPTPKQSVILGEKIKELKAMCGGDYKKAGGVEKAFASVLSDLNARLLELKTTKEAHSLVFKSKVYNMNVAGDLPKLEDTKSFFSELATLYSFYIQLMNLIFNIKKDNKDFKLDCLPEFMGRSSGLFSDLELSNLYTNLLNAKACLRIDGAGAVADEKDIFPILGSENNFVKSMSHVLNNKNTHEIVFDFLSLQTQLRKKAVMLSVVERGSVKYLQLHGLIPTFEDFSLIFVADIGAWFNPKEFCLEVKIDDSNSFAMGVESGNVTTLAADLANQSSLKLMNFLIENVDYVIDMSTKEVRGNYVIEALRSVQEDGLGEVVAVDSLVRPS